MDDWGGQDLQRRLANLIRVATITDLDDTKALARVTNAAMPNSAWLPILANRAGPDRSYWLPEPGEQVLVLSPSGDTSQGVILGSLYQDAHAPPASDRNLHRVEYDDGTAITYDRIEHVLSVHCVGDMTGDVDGDVNLHVDGSLDATVQGSITAKTPAHVTIDAPQTTVTGALTVQGLLTYAAGMSGSGGIGAAASIDGSITATGDVTAGNISLEHHTHGGVKSGGSSTGQPD